MSAFRQGVIAWGRRPGINVELSGSDEAGLNRPCAVQQRPVRVDRSAVTEILGALNPHDHAVLFAFSVIAA
jgi:hypothetical protein